MRTTTCKTGLKANILKRQSSQMNDEMHILLGAYAQHPTHCSGQSQSFSIKTDVLHRNILSLSRGFSKKLIQTVNDYNRC